MSLENVLSGEMVDRVGWTLVHFLWQGAVLAVVLLAELALLRKSKANVRYIAACVTLTLMALVPLVTMFAVPVSESEFKSAADIGMAESSSNAGFAGSVEVSTSDTFTSTEPIAAKDAAPVAVPVEFSYSWKERVRGIFEAILPYLVSGWLVGVFGLSVWHLGGWTQLQRMRRRMVKQTGPPWQSRVKELAELLGIRRAVQLMESALVRVPTVVGWLRPVILLPASALTGLSCEQLEALLAHELAHIKRYDYLVNMLQTAVEILGFYHPAVWWVSHKIRLERENCCDDLAVRVCGDKVCYAKALTSMEEIRGGQAGLAVAASGGSLLGRIRRLVGRGSREEARYSWLPAAITVLLILAIAVPTTIALNAGQDKNLDMEVEGTLPAVSSAEAESGELQKRGEEILKRMGQVNRYWLVGPPAEVKNYAYDFILTDREPETVKTIQISEPSSVFRNFRHGITYYSVLHKLVSEPASVVTTGIEQADEIIRLDFKLTDSLDVESGNGIAHSWRGYFIGPVKEGTLWLEAERMVPLRMKAGWEEESFTDYVALSPGHYVPLAVSVAYERTHYDWKFALHEPGLWLFEEAHYGQDEEGRARRVAWVENVKVNDESIRETNVPTLGLEYLPAIVEAHETQTQGGQNGFLLTTRTKDDVMVRAVGAPGRLGFDITGHFGLEPKKRLSIQLVTIPRDPDIWTENQRQLRKAGRQLLNACGGFVRPRGVDLENGGHEGEIRIFFVFMGKEDPTRRIRLTVELKDGGGKSLATRTWECEDQRIYAREYNASHPKSRFRLMGVNDARLEFDARLLERTERVAVMFEESVAPRPGSEGGKSAAKDEVEGEVSEVPKVIMLKYADAEDLSEYLNAVFNEPGASSGIRLDEMTNLIGRVRFIPDPGRKAVLVLCPAESMGSVEEMIKELDRPRPGIRVRKFPTLSNGVTVELVGICEHPSEGKQWWRPDGGILQERPYERLHDREAYGDLRLFEVVYRVQPGKGVQSRIDKTEAIAGSFGPYPIERETEGVSEFAKGSLYAYVPVKDGLDKIDLAVVCGTQERWRTHARIESPVERAGMNTDKVNLSARAGEGNRTIAFVTHRIFDEDVRVIAKDKSGGIHKPASDRRKGMSWAGSITAEFDLPVGEVASIEVQTQKFDRVVFKNVSLKPGVKTDVEVAVGHAAVEIPSKPVKLGVPEERTLGENKREEKRAHMLDSIREQLEKLRTMYDTPKVSEGPRSGGGIVILEDFTDSQVRLALSQYQRQVAAQDEARRQMLDLIKEQIEKLRIIYDDPEPSGVLLGVYERPGEEEGKRQDRRLSRKEIVAKLVNLEQNRSRVQRELNIAEEALEEVRKRWGFTDLEKRSYPHPVTQRLIRLERERDDCALAIVQLQANIKNLEERADTPEGKAKLKKAQDDLVVLHSKLGQLEKMREEAAAKKRDLDMARVQYRQRKGISDERKRMLDSIKSEIERLRILHDDPVTPDVVIEDKKR